MEKPYPDLVRLLLFRLDVSQYYVIRTIIIFNAGRGMGSQNPGGELDSGEAAP